MELKKFFQIFSAERKMFFFVWIGVAGIIIFWQISRPITYDTVLSLHVARQGSEEIVEGYQYDNFYRLQADERFSDTIVRWLSSPRMVLDIYKGASIDMSERKNAVDIFDARRLSSQYIEVRYSTKTHAGAEKIAQSLNIVVNEKIRGLDESSNRWFFILVDDPVIEKNTFSFVSIAPIALSLGIFFAFWSVLFWYYWGRDD